ncbi:retrovirus-related pol polyprotein from transposon TNT 1-94 [Tanacetum coccineum]
MLAHNPSSSYNGRPTFANPKYLKKSQNEKPSLYTVPFDKDDLANIFAPDSAETIILEQESRSKLNKDKRLLSGNLLVLLEIFMKTTYFRGTRGSDLYTITLQDLVSPTPICFLAKASPTQAWLWHCRLSHRNFDTINLLSKNDIMNGLPKLKFVKDQLCSFCEMGKAKRSSFKIIAVTRLKKWLDLLHMKIKHQKFLNKTLHAYFKEEGIEHQTSTPRTPEQNDVVERWNRTLVEVARTMLSASKILLFFWAEAIAIACYTQNRSLIIPSHEKTPYHIINDRKPTLKHYHIFGCTCYLTRDGENLDKMKEKGDPRIFMGYYTQSKGYRIFYKKTKLIVESIHIKFDEIQQMESDYNNSGPAPPRQLTFEHNCSSLGTNNHNNEPSSSKLVRNNYPPADSNAPSLQELDFLFSPLFEEYFTARNQSISKSFALSDNSQQQDTNPTSNVQPTTKPITPTTVHVEENNTD